MFIKIKRAILATLGYTLLWLVISHDKIMTYFIDTYICRHSPGFNELRRNYVKKVIIYKKKYDNIAHQHICESLSPKFKK